MQTPAPARRGTPRKRVHAGSEATASETSRQLHASGAERVAVRVEQHALNQGRAGGHPRTGDARPPGKQDPSGGGGGGGGATGGRGHPPAAGSRGPGRPPPCHHTSNKAFPVMLEAERGCCLENVGREQHVAGERNR